MLEDLTWTCHVCKKERPDNKISVFSTDISAERDMPAGTLKQNVRYCNDREQCTEKAKTHRLFPHPIKTGRTCGQCGNPVTQHKPTCNKEVL